MISEKLITLLTAFILNNTEFEEKLSPPEFITLSKEKMSDKACFSSKNCKVKAYYVKEGKIFYIDSMRPESNVCDKSIILHELVHHYQKNSGKKIDLDEKNFMDSSRKTGFILSKSFFDFRKKKK